MKFSELAECFERLESTTKRLEMIDILSEMFKKSSLEEIKRIIYLCQGQILPPYKGIVIGMAEKLILRVISRVSNKSIKVIEKIYKKNGDLGLTAEHFAKQESKGLSVSEVYDTFLKIAKASGKGSVEVKINMLCQLLSKSNTKEAKYVARFPIGRLRLGIGDPTILDGLCVSKFGDKSFRPELERAFNLLSDLGEIAKIFFEKGKQGIRNVKIQVGVPIRPALAERLSSAKEIVKKIGKCLIEVKIDGFRCEVHKKGNNITIFSRNLESTTHMFPEIVEGVRKQIKAKDIIFEGEAVAMNEDTGEFYPFQVTMQRKRKYEIQKMKQEYPLVLFAFDLLYADGIDYTRKPLIERKNKLESLILKGNGVRIPEKIITDDPKEINKFFEKAIEEGLEGAMAKRLEAHYQAGSRNFNWIKLKRSYKSELTDTIDAVIIGYFKGRGMRAAWGIGALLVAVYNKKKDVFESVARVGSGLSEENWKKLRKMLDKISIKRKPARVVTELKPDAWIEPMYVLKLKADEITRSTVHSCGFEKGKGYALRFPRVEGWVRFDKKPEDSNSTKEIKDMFKRQKHVKVKSIPI